MAQPRHRSSASESSGFFARWIDGIAEARLKQAQVELAHADGYGRTKIAPLRPKTKRKTRKAKSKPH